MATFKNKNTAHIQEDSWMWMGGELLLVLPPLLSRQETKLRFGNTAVNLIKVKINLQKARRTRDGAGEQA